MLSISTAQLSNKFMLEWMLEAGIDEFIQETPNNYFSNNKPLILTPEASKNLTIISNQADLYHSPTKAMMAAREIASSCHNLSELEAAVRSFEGCALKKTATKTVFADGNSDAKIMLIGEAPDASEDVKGISFCGANGHLLDKMLAAIGLNRQENIYISNSIFWRPAGNRQPTAEEISICLPFVEKHIALISPEILILSGGTATRALLNNDQAISRLRGKFYTYKNEYITTPIKTALIYHPSYLLRQPQYKKQTWQDLLMIKKTLYA